jgi:hypothetical protein
MIRVRQDGQDMVFESLDRGYGGAATELFRLKDTNAKVTLALDSNQVGGKALSAAAFRPLYHAGVAAAGPVTLTGAKVGDKVAQIINLTDGTGGESLFESTISVADQIQQTSASDLSAKKFAFLLIAMT